jgi:T5SS/PEP-CTERM-associated repeat protein
MWTNLVFCFVGQDGNGTLNITDGASVSDCDALVGGSSTGVAIVDGPGSTWFQLGTLTIGGNAGATGTLTISNGGNVYTGGSGGTFGSVIAYNAGSSGTVNVSGVGSTWMNKGPLAVSDVGGDRALHISSGGTVSNRYCILGTFDGSGNVTVEGVDSTWTISGDLSVGGVFGGIGTVTISQSGQVTSANGFIADGSSSTGTVQLDGAGSTWTNSGNVYVGGNASGAVGTGELHLTNGGTASAAAVTVWSTGTILGDGFVQTTNGVTNQGTLSPDQTISITGNLAFSSTAMMLSTVTPSTADSVMVQGGAAPNGHLGVTLTGGPFIAGTQYTLLQANGGLNGTTFSSVSISSPPGVNAQVTYDMNHVYLVIKGSGTPTPTPTSTPSGTPTPTATSTPTPRLTPTPRPRPTPAPRP